MNILNNLGNISLTNKQKDALLKIESYLTSHENVFILKGYAGTGKTFLMQLITKYLKELKRQFVIMAPTGRAAKVIFQKTKQKAYTIHKTIYSRRDLKEFKTKNQEGTETYKFYFELKNNDDPNNTIYIIDEASMLSNAYQEEEFFRHGSGFLLNDLIKYINPDNNDHNKKIIFIGDNAQLPPVNMNFSPSLDKKYLKDNYNLSISEFELTEVVRQKTDSGILYNATKFRKSINSNIFNQIEMVHNFNDIEEIKHENFFSKYLKTCNNSIDNKTLIIAYSNSSVQEYNNLVRNYFFPNKKSITIGDYIIVIKNNYSYSRLDLLNGDFGIVKEVSPICENRTIKLKRKNSENKVVEISVPLSFRDVTITFSDEKSENVDIKCKIIENLLYSHQRNLSSDELKAIYLDFLIRNPNLKSGTKEFKETICSDIYFNAIQIKFGYAITCHKAQGGEWKNIFLDCKSTMGYLNSNYFRWLYTGFTRATENLFILNEPHYSIGSNLQPPKIENINQRKNILVLNTEILELEIPFDFSNEIPFLKHIYLAVKELFKDSNITINNIRHTNYSEHYTFSQGNEISIFIINYNKQNKITKIQKPLKTNNFIDKIDTILLQLHNITIQCPILESDKPKINIEFKQEFLKEFYNHIKNKLEPFGFLISKIEHKPFHEIYEITKNGFFATYKFWYDRKSKFKKIELIETKTTGLVNEINKLLKGD